MRGPKPVQLCFEVTFEILQFVLEYHFGMSYPLYLSAYMENFQFNTVTHLSLKIWDLWDHMMKNISVIDNLTSHTNITTEHLGEYLFIPFPLLRSTLQNIYPGKVGLYCTYNL